MRKNFIQNFNFNLRMEKIKEFIWVFNVWRLLIWCVWCLNLDKIRCKCVNYCNLGGRRSIDHRVFLYRRRIGEHPDILRRNQAVVLQGQYVYRFIYNIDQSIKIVQKILEVEWEDCLLILHHIPDKCSQCIVLMTIYHGQIACTCKLIHG